MQRRAFLCGGGLASMAVAALLPRALTARAVAAPVRAEALTWLREVAAATQGLRGGSLAQADWQQALADLFARVPLADLLASIDFPVLAAALSLPGDRAGTIDPTLPDIAGLPRWPECGLRLFGMARGRAIVPHGHANMVSAHLVVQGEMHVRHYQRERDEDAALVLRPTIDRHSGPGEATTVSDHHDNVHWLVARSAAAYTLDFIVLDLDPGRTTRWGDFVDIRAAQRLGDGRLRAPRIDFATAIARYGRDET
ncbi:MAG: hypothetical protein KF823_02995 [Xanthomonadales bacterium]|nr:hypothetical protein [Xanthomonadales bacterium]